MQRNVPCLGQSLGAVLISQADAASKVRDTSTRIDSIPARPEQLRVCSPWRWPHGCATALAGRCCCRLCLCLDRSGGGTGIPIRRRTFVAGGLLIVVAGFLTTAFAF